jgi:hypothetical protein
MDDTDTTLGDQMAVRSISRDCQIGTDGTCRLAPIVESHSTSLNDAHSKLREHGSQIVELRSTTTHLVERMTRGEGAALEQHRLLIALQGSVDSIRSEQTATARSILGVSHLVENTHKTLREHVEHSIRRDEELSTIRLKHQEGSAMRGVRTFAVLAGIFLLLTMLHGLISGVPLWPSILGLFR